MVHAGRTSRSPDTHRGLTLLEVLLVLCVLVLLTALIWPALNRMFINYRLRVAADQVRIAWAKARVEAMDSGRIHRFSYEPDSGNYRVEAGALQSSSDVFDEAEAQDALDSENLTPSGSSAALTRSICQGTLPEGIRFAVGQTESNSRDASALQAPENFGVSPAFQETGCTPIFFYPDGTTSTARVLIGDAKGRGIELSLRGLTGVVTVSDIVSLEREELP